MKKSKVLAAIVIIFFITIVTFFIGIKTIKTPKGYKKVIILKTKNIQPQDLAIIKINKKKYITGHIIASPSDTVKANNSTIYTNNTKIDLNFKRLYRINCFTDWQDNYITKNYHQRHNPLRVYYLKLTEKQTKIIKDTGIMITPIIDKKGLGTKKIYPFTFKFRWNKDNFGPIIIPYKGMKISGDNTLSLYKYTIQFFEKQTIKKNKTFVFKQNYVYMLNRDLSNTRDSRYYGPIPEKNIVGKIIWHKE